ncbi:hypothetical protein ACQP2T_63435 (plasmid) [Nonomuraea sp. CA-143628]|uniref:hypothetical protein n=1 Tax=Nonomuraea sp. CA-143628 TaxID=3239997 RepID=UPI003D8A41D0
METVWISHPKLPDRKVEVPAESLPQHQRAGWELTATPDTRPATIQALIDGGWDPDEARAAVDAAMPDPPPDGDQTSEAPEDTSGASSLPETPRARRSTKGDS